MEQKSLKYLQTISRAGTVITQDPILATPIIISGKQVYLSPILVGTMYRISSKALALTANMDLNSLTDNIDLLSGILALVNTNKEEAPTQNEIENFSKEFNAIQLFGVLSTTVGDNAAAGIKEYFLEPSEMYDTKEARSIAQARRDALPQTLLGSYCKYFKTTLREVLWKTTWDNMVLMLSAIEKPQKEEYDKDGNPLPAKNGRFRYPVKDASEVF